jgi:hypothetical protein
MPQHEHTTPTAWVGIDISKDTLDACLLPAHGRPCCRSFRNDTAGHAKNRAPFDPSWASNYLLDNTPSSAVQRFLEGE